MDVSALSAETSPASGDLLLINVGGAWKKLDIDDLPGGGGGGSSDIVGQIKILAHDTLPALHLWCDGAEVSRTTYADLFAVIGTAFGIGDGTTTFNLPDMQDRYVVGASTTKDLASYIGSETIVLTSDNIPAHTHDVNLRLTSSGPTDEGDGAYLHELANIYGDTSGFSGGTLAATTSGSTGSADPINLIPLSVVLKYAICYELPAGGGGGGITAEFAQKIAFLGS
jgi:microcystin-dependent protein